MIDVDAQRTALKTEGETLRMARAAALIDGSKFATCPRLVEIDDELAALAEAEIEIARQASRAARDEAERRRRAAVDFARAREADRYAALQEAEKLAVGLAEAIQRFRALTDEQVIALAGIGLVAPLCHWRAQVERRLSELLVTTLLTPISGRGGTLGSIEWRPAPPEATAPWSAYEMRACASALETTINPDSGNTDDIAAA